MSTRPNRDVYELPFRRIAVTVPPDHWFHGIAKALFEIYRQGLVELGLAVFDVPVEPFIAVDPIRIRFLAEELRDFRPDLAFGLPKGSYALLCRLPPRRDGSRPNLFTEILDIPTICFWDHAPVELADQMLAPLPAEPDLSMPGAIEALRRVLTHPRLVHWSRDAGQSERRQRHVRTALAHKHHRRGRLIAHQVRVVVRRRMLDATRPRPASDRPVHVPMRLETQQTIR